jgi:hypothetical protein
MHVLNSGTRVNKTIAVDESSNDRSSDEGCGLQKAGAEELRLLDARCPLLSFVFKDRYPIPSRSRETYAGLRGPQR